MHQHHLTCGNQLSLLHSVNLILFTLLVHLVLCMSPHHSHHIRSHHLSLPQPFTPNLKLISFTNPFLHSFLIASGLPSRILNLYWTKWALAFVLVACARLGWSHLGFESTLNSVIVSYRIISRGFLARLSCFFMNVIISLSTPWGLCGPRGPKHDTVPIPVPSSYHVASFSISFSLPPTSQTFPIAWFGAYRRLIS